MMSEAAAPARPILRRIALLLAGLLALAAIALAAAAAVVATRDYDGLRDELIRIVERDLPGRVRLGAARARLLPYPHLALEQVEIAAIDGRFGLTAPSIVAVLDPLDLLRGRIERPELRIERAEIRLATGNLAPLAQSPREIAALFDQLTRAFDQRPAVAAIRVRVADARVTLAGAAGPRGDITLDGIAGRLRYDRNRGRIDARARRGAEGEAAEAVLSLPTRRALAEGGRDAAFVELSGLGSRLAFNGRIARSSEIAANGTLEMTLGPRFEALFGLTAERRELVPALTLSAAAVLDGRGANLEALKVARGAASLTGIAALRENAGRWSLSSTLAGDLVDGSAADAALRRLTDRRGGWSAAPLELDPAPGIDLDIRLSTRAFRLGRLNLEDVALSIFTRPGRAELALADARFGEGQIKARALVVSRGDTQELKLSLSGERLDAERFLDAAFGLARLKGRGNFVIQAESHGAGIADFARNLSGSGTFDIQRGEIAGIDLARLAARNGEAMSEAALVGALGGRSPFDALTVNLAVRNGVAEPVGASLKAARFEGSLEGSVDLGSQRHQLWGLVRPRSENGQAGDVFAARIEGPLLAPVLRPDPGYLARRS